MPIISILNQKGGPGKSTITVNLAVAFALDDKKVLIIDTDTQGSTINWYGEREKKPDVTVIGVVNHNALRKAIVEHEDAYDIVLIDGVPSVSDVTGVSVFGSHLVLIPIEPSAQCLWATEPVVERVFDVQGMRPELKARFILNKYPTMTTNLGKDITDALQGQEIATLNSILHNRISYPDAFGCGQSVLEWKDKKAKKEVQCLYEEVKELVYG